MALTRWSLAKLPAHLAEQGIALCSEEALRRRCSAPGSEHQRTRSWKWSPDPDFKPKAERVLGLYREARRTGPVVCFDEMGPIQLIPHQGSGWAPVGGPSGCGPPTASAAACATCSAPMTSTPTACSAACAPTRAAARCSAFCSQIRMRYPPRLRIYLIDGQPLHPQDHRHPQLGRRQQRRAGLTPTYASFLNRIECHFWAISEFVINNADYPDWDTLAKAMADHIHYRNRPHGGGPIAQIEARRRVA